MSPTTNFMTLSPPCFSKFGSIKNVKIFLLSTEPRRAWGRKALLHRTRTFIESVSRETTGERPMECSRVPLGHMGHMVVLVLLVCILSGQKKTNLADRLLGRRSSDVLGCRWAPQWMPPLMLNVVTPTKNSSLLIINRLLPLKFHKG